MTFADEPNFFLLLAAVYIRFYFFNSFIFIAEPSLLSCFFHILPTNT